MKKLLIGAAVAVMLISPTVAKAGNDWVGPAIIGTVLGVIIGSNSHHSPGHNIIVQDSHHNHQHHSRQGWWYRDRPLYEWVRVCKRYPYLRQDHHGHYYQVFRNECRMVRKARW